VINVDTLKHQVGKHGRQGSAPGEFRYPARALTIGSRAYVCNSWNHRVQVFDLPDWKFAFEFGDFFCPKWIETIRLDGRDMLVVVDTNNARLCFHEADGERVTIFRFESQSFPVATRLLDSETIQVTFEDEHTESFDIAEITAPCDWRRRFEKPVSIVCDNRGVVYVSDFGRRTVEKFDQSGRFIAQVAGPDVLTLPGKMAMNGDDLLIADRPANSVIIYDTIAGNLRRWDHSFDGPGFIGRDPGGNIWVGTYTCEPNPDGATFAVFSARYEFLRTVIVPEAHQPTSITFIADQLLISDQDARNVFVHSEDENVTRKLREAPFDAPVWSVMTDGAGHIYTGAGPIVDLFWSAGSNRVYYIDFEQSLVRHSRQFLA